jgi:hypothetical protein
LAPFFPQDFGSVFPTRFWLRFSHKILAPSFPQDFGSTFSQKVEKVEKVEKIELYFIF